MEYKAYYVGHADGDKTIYNGRVDTETSTYNATSDNVRIAVDNKNGSIWSEKDSDLEVNNYNCITNKKY